jgi:Arc/MetJ-type ribon-helix-helix transcriptional regulator
MTIHLTPEQERRLRAVLDGGSYKSVEEVVEAALTAVEQRTVPGFAADAMHIIRFLHGKRDVRRILENE